MVLQHQRVLIFCVVSLNLYICSPRFLYIEQACAIGGSVACVILLILCVLYQPISAVILRCAVDVLVMVNLFHGGIIRMSR